MLSRNNLKTNLLEQYEETSDQDIKNLILLETENLSSATSLEFLLDNQKSKELR
jgi:hypothetical protein